MLFGFAANVARILNKFRTDRYERKPYIKWLKDVLRFHPSEMSPGEAVRIVFDFLKAYSPEKLPLFERALVEAMSTSGETLVTSTFNTVQDIQSSLEVSARLS